MRLPTPRGFLMAYFRRADLAAANGLLGDGDSITNYYLATGRPAGADWRAYEQWALGAGVNPDEQVYVEDSVLGSNIDKGAGFMGFDVFGPGNLLEGARMFALPFAAAAITSAFPSLASAAGEATASAVLGDSAAAFTGESVSGYYGATEAELARAAAGFEASAAGRTLMPPAVPESPAALKEMGLVEKSPGWWSMPAAPGDSVFSLPGIPSGASDLMREFAKTVGPAGERIATGAAATLATGAIGRLINPAPELVADPLAQGAGFDAGGSGLLIGAAVVAVAVGLYVAKAKKG